MKRDIILSRDVSLKQYALKFTLILSMHYCQRLCLCHAASSTISPLSDTD